ncbi:MAG: twin-arginine translocase TatA/TatE family subunit [Nocardioides sp.]|nr:twin-arginine translocase TatA/TatE family subunit [Nocardioides sp.]
MMYPLIGSPGPWEIALILLVILMFFGAAKLPELARGTGRALRIFKAETKGLIDDDDEDEDSSSESKGSAAELKSPDERAEGDPTVSPETHRDTTN